MKKRILSILLAAALLLGGLPVHGLAAQNDGEQASPYQVRAEISPDGEDLNVGDTVTIRITVSSTDSRVKKYNSYDLKLIYDEKLLRYESGTAADRNAEITEGNGQIRVKGYGEDKALDVAVVSLDFRITAEGEAKITLEEAKIDQSDNAGLQNAPLAQVPEESVVIHASVYYRVTLLGYGLRTDSRVASPKEDFSFRVEDPELYDYELSVTAGGADITDKLICDGGTYIIPKEYITGDIVIRATRTPKPTEPEPTDPKPTDPQPTDPEPTDPQPTDPKPTDPKPTDPQPTEPQPTDPKPTDPQPTDPQPSESQPTEPAPEYVSVVFTGSGAEDASGDGWAVKGNGYTFRVNQTRGYTYTISVYVSGKTVHYEYDGQRGSYYISGDKVTGDITISISKTSNVEVKEYLTLEGEVMYLILYRGSVDRNQAPRYDGYKMYWSDLYDTYAWLVVSSTDVETVWQNAVNSIAFAEGADAEHIRYSGNVNMSLHTDTDDAELIRDMYRAKYTVDNMEMLQFLNADVNGDGKLDIRDAAAVVTIILKEEEERT